MPFDLKEESEDIEFELGRAELEEDLMSVFASSSSLVNSDEGDRSSSSSVYKVRPSNPFFKNFSQFAPEENFCFEERPFASV